MPMTYRGPWQFCEWGHGWFDSRQTPHCTRCVPACFVAKADGSPCKGTPLAETGICPAHSRQIAKHLAELVG